MSFQPKIAFVLAAGLGTRMRPLTETKPKPLLEVQGRSLIDRMIDRLVVAGVETAVINTFYLGEMIEEQLSKRDDIEIIFSREDERLETGGGIKNALHLLGDEPFYVTSSDVIVEDVAFKKLSENWRDDLAGLLLTHKVSDSYGYDGAGDFDLESLNGPTSKFKFRSGEVADYVFTTIQILDPKIFTSPEVEEFGKVFPLKKIYDLYLDKMEVTVNDGKWFHIGTPEALSEMPKLGN